MECWEKPIGILALFLFCYAGLLSFEEKISDVVFEESYASLMLQGKTGARRVIVVASLPYTNELEEY